MSVKSKLLETLEDFSYVYDNYIPDLTYKIRDKLCLRGKQVAYEDFTRYIMREGIPIPVWGACANPTKEDKVVDMAPFICCALPELLLHLPCVGDFFLDIFISDLYNRNIFKDTSEFAKLAYKYNDMWEVCGEKEDGLYPTIPLELGVFCSLQRLWHTKQYESVRDLSNGLILLWLHNRPQFVDFMMGVCELLYPFIDIFIGTHDSPLFEDRQVDKIFHKFKMTHAETVKFGALSLRSEDEDSGAITDGCGVGAYTIVSLCRELYRNWLYSSAKHETYILRDDAYVDLVIRSVIHKSVGTDFASRYLNGKAKRIPSFNMDMAAQTLIGHGVIPTEGNRTYTQPETGTFSLALYQSILVSGSVFGSEKLASDRAWVNCHFGTTYSFTHAVTMFCDEDSFTKNVEAIPPERYEKIRSDVEKSVRKEYNGWVNRNEYNGVCSENKRLQSTIDTMESRIRELESLLNKKQDIVNKLSTDVRDLNKQMQSYYSDIDVDGQKNAEEVSIADMVEFLNEFAIILGGGFNTLTSRCNKIGWTNINQLLDENFVRGTTLSGDFFVINTRFISHRTVEAMRSMWKKQSDCFIYYNGTSVEGLVTACYKFILNFLN